MPDAVVVGARHNGLVAATLLADQGWSVLVLEEQDAPGGSVQSADYLGAGYVADVCSAFFPLTVASPVFESLELELVGQMTTADPQRSPHGTETLWAYTHVPRKVLGDTQRPTVARGVGGALNGGTTQLTRRASR